jgi:hypothetical protein
MSTVALLGSDSEVKLPRVALDELIEAGDLDELVREVDRLCDRRDWAGLVRLRDLSRAALARGRQLWPAASLAEYRLALEAPGRYAALAVAEQAGRFTLGPLAEVAASTHTWAELAPFLDGPAGGPVAAVVAHERVVRGEDVVRAGSGESAFDPFAPLPLVLQPWEPAYAVATYRPDRLEAPMPGLPPLPPQPAAPLPGTISPAAADPAAAALLQLADAWVTGSNGRASAVAVNGSALDAISALGVPAARTVPLAPADAMALMAWTAASGGAHARRRGMAAGRFDAWWAAAALAGVDDDWAADELGAALAELRWFLWDAGEPDTGWWFRLAVDDPAHGLAWAVAASDAT